MSVELEIGLLGSCNLEFWVVVLRYFQNERRVPRLGVLLNQC